MLGSFASEAGEKTGGAWLDRERRSVPSLTGLPAKTQDARGKQRQADDLIELCLVVMPPDSRSRPILVNQHLAEDLRRSVKYCGNLIPQEDEKGRKRRSLNDSTTVVVTAVSEAHHLASGQIPMKVERSEWEVGKLMHKRALFIGERTFGR